MESSEYENLERVERVHWFYDGKRRIVRRWIERLRPLGADDVLLDFGAGTGLFAEEMAPSCRVLALDSFPESLERLRRRLPPAQVIEPTAAGRIPVPDASVDCVTALDVLEHVERDAAAVAEFRRVLRPGGLAVVTVPASMLLWSDWDVSLHHFRRYESESLRALFGDGWTIERLAHVNSLAFPLVWMLRRARRGGRQTGPRAEDRVPPCWLNALLRWQFVAQATLRRGGLPFGVGLLLVARRESGNGVGTRA
ncbi:MAG TPA: class I SAM-dependent methyltransferase [Opitutaceae bacterium]|nr:class I SAM-dependent methyltransferase [Opitutaceae bacterium]